MVVDDGSTDRTWPVLQEIQQRIPELRPVQNTGPARLWPRHRLRPRRSARGDAVVIMMADESDDCRDVVRYWQVLNEGWDCVFGSRFVKGGGVDRLPPVQAPRQPAGQPLHPAPLPHPAQRHHQRLQGLSPDGDPRLRAADLARTSI